MSKPITVTELRGMKMIKDLQALAGIDEPDASALKGWREMSRREKKGTTQAWRTFCKTKAKPSAN